MLLWVKISQVVFLGNIIAGIIGSWLGGTLLGHWGPELGSIYILPALIGSIILIALVTLILRAK